MPSRQREWQKRRAAEGKCEICGKVRNLYSRLCDEHAIKHRDHEREAARARRRAAGVSERPNSIGNSGPKSRTP